MTDKEKAERVISFLTALHDLGKYDVRFFAEAARSHGEGLVSIPATVQGEGLDAYDKATILQSLEEKWNYRKPAPEFEALLRPAVGV